MTTIPPPLLMAERDSSQMNQLYIQTDINYIMADDEVIEHGLIDLEHLYSSAFIARYDASQLGFTASAELLASQISIGLNVTSYLDLGTGTGLTARACARRLVNSGNSFQLVLLDGLIAMIEQALDKMHNEFDEDSEPKQIHGIRGEILGDLAISRAFISDHYFITSFSLITAQRVFLNVRKDRRLQQLRHWASYLSQGGQLVVDIPHPRRCIGAMFIGRSYVNPSATRPALEKCRVIADEQTWQECRDYAKQLATQANLVITNGMPAQLPEADVEDGLPVMRSWINQCRAISVPEPLSDREFQWFGRRYFQAATSHYEERGFVCNAEIAAVIAVFERAPVTTTKLSTVKNTKYNIDDSKTGKARRNAKARAAKKEKKALGHDEDNDGGVEGAGAVA